MMKSKRVILIVMGILLASAGVSYGQSLGAYARKERAKEASQPKAVKVYTNDNIPHSTSLQEPAAAASQAGSTGTPAKAPEEKEAESAGTASSAASQTPDSEKPPEDRMKTKEYWQAKFTEVQGNLHRADEALKLSEDELNLEQMNQARELDPQKKAVLDQKVKDKQAAAQSSRAAYDKAKQALEDLQKEFDESGAPKDWLPAPEKQ